MIYNTLLVGLGLFTFLVIVLAKNDTEEVLDMCSDSDDIYSYTNNRTDTCRCTKNELCVRKCCKVGFFHSYEEDYHENIFLRNCTRMEQSSKPFRVPIHEGVKKVYELKDKFIVGMLNCYNPKWQYFKIDNGKSEERVYIQKNGSLYYPDINRMYDSDRYCVDEEDGLSFYVCYTPESKDKILSRLFLVAGMIISMPFLLITFLVYAIVPESNLHRKALMNYVMTLLLAYIFLVTVQLYPGRFDEKVVCPMLGYLIIFFFLVSFFWMNVICLDMWFAFSGMRAFNGRRLAERKRFIMYFIYAFGVPLIHILIVFLINTYGEENASYFPGIGREKCFLRDGLPNLYYFYGPMAILITINVTLFVLTAVKIQKVKKETSMLKQSDSKRHSYEDDKQKFNLYVKLLFAMGINWTMEVISWVIEYHLKILPSYVWYLTDFCNAMYGVFIFFIFVFKKKIWRSLKKRYYVLRGKPHFAHSMSVTQTTRSSNFSTTETGLNDHRLSELRNGRAEERMLPQN